MWAIQDMIYIRFCYQSVGGELEGLIFISPKLRLTYSAGYDYIFSGGYKTSQGRAKFDSGSTIRASVGLCVCFE